MAGQSVEVLVDGGKATAGPPLGPALGPLGVNVIQIVNRINDLTKAYAGMKVPVKVLEDLDRIGREKKEAKRLGREYDFFVAEAPLMPLVGKVLGQALGPRGKMPTPIPPTAPIDDIIKRQRRNVRLKMKDQPVIQVKVGTEDMPDDVLVQNIQTVISRLESKLEKGQKNISAVSVKTTMGPLVKVATTQV